jgi:hypothetical protein
MRLSTKRLVELHNLADNLQSRARLCFNSANALRSIGNTRGANYCSARGLRCQVVAERATKRIEMGK